MRKAAVVDEPWASYDFSYAQVKAILDFTACSSLGRSGLGLRGWLDGLCRVGSGEWVWFNSGLQTASAYWVLHYVRTEAVYARRAKVARGCSHHI